jgi:pimeloyl-ACP methyl ester carboxylesterase
MNKVTSADGTEIAFDQSGDGPPVIIVGGAFSDRAHFVVTQIAELLAPHFTVYNYDRRGRGDSGNTLPYAIEREVEDLAALIEHAGGSANVFGLSSGAALALEAAAAGLNITKLALHEPPYVVDDKRGGDPRPTAKELTELTDAGKRTEAVEVFMTAMGLPAPAIEGMKQAPMWPGLEGLAHTLAYDAALTGDDDALPADRAANIKSATLTVDCDSSPEWLRNTTKAVADAIPNASHTTLEGQDHFTMNPADLAPVLVKFFRD